MKKLYDVYYPQGGKINNEMEYNIPFELVQQVEYASLADLWKDLSKTSLPNHRPMTIGDIVFDISYKSWYMADNMGFKLISKPTIIGLTELKFEDFEDKTVEIPEEVLAELFSYTGTITFSQLKDKFLSTVESSKNSDELFSRLEKMIRIQKAFGVIQKYFDK